MGTKKIFSLLLLTALTVRAVKADFLDRFGDKSKAFGTAGLAVVLYQVGYSEKAGGLLGEKLSAVVGNTLAASGAFISASYVASNIGKKDFSEKLKKSGSRYIPALVLSSIIMTHEAVKCASRTTIEETDELKTCLGVCQNCGMGKIGAGILLAVGIKEAMDKAVGYLWGEQIVKIKKKQAVKN